MSSPTRDSLHSAAFIVLAAVVIAVGVGCGDFEEAMNAGRETPVSQPEPKPPRGAFLNEPNGEASPAASDPAQAAAADGNRNGANPNPNIGPAATQPKVLPIHLSAGVALAQTLPDGTAMSFSVDYQFRDGTPNQSNKYFWVVEGRGGKSLRQQRQLKSEGNLTLIAPGLRPEAGPFSSHILEITPDGSQRKISRSIDMR